MNTISRDMPQAAYTILDIRSAGDVNDKSSSNKRLDGAPPSPPASTHPSEEDAFNSADLVDTLLDSLDQPRGQKSIPTFVLYDTLGLQLFDQITQLEEYYLTNAERAILQEHADDLADRVKQGSIIIELGAGSLRKTELILQAMERKKKKVTYYALDLDQHELEKSLSSLGGKYKYVQLMGLLGTYDQGIPWLSQQYTSKSTPKIVLWLGSSIGNQSRQESAVFLRRLQRTCLQPGDLCVIGFDRRNDPTVIAKAYDDAQGVTRKFIMNGLDHVNAILGQSLLRQEDFDYDSRYQPIHGRHVAHYRSKKDLTLTYTRKNKNSGHPQHQQQQQEQQQQQSIKIAKGELIHVEHSYKYNLEEITHILNAAELHLVEQWMDKSRRYRLVLTECRPFHFESDNQGTMATLFDHDVRLSQQETLDCATCDTSTKSDDSSTPSDEEQANNAGSLVNITGTKRWPHAVPSLHEWEQLWTSWDVVTRTMLDHNTMLFERPIALRHPFIFYLGHIPAFLDIMLTRHHADQEILEGAPHLTHPAIFSDIFERGIDPDMDDPAQCNPHSEVPVQNQDWPSVTSILEYQQRVRNRLQRLLLHWEGEGYNHMDDPLAWMTVPSRQRAARVVWMCFEHEAMHLETLLYMLLQSPNVKSPSVAPPAWYNNHLKSISTPSLNILSAAPMISLSGNTKVQLGHDDDEALDGKIKVTSVEFGWDNEHPKRSVSVSPFEIQSRPVTNGEYWQFWHQQNNSSSLWPASWGRNDDHQQDALPFIKTAFGPCDFKVAVNWPVQVSCQQAESYAASKEMRLPTEGEYVVFRQTIEKDLAVKDDEEDSLEKEQSRRRDVPNVGFASWTPLPLDNRHVHVVGDIWEWTSTVWSDYPGYKRSELYPGYSADFFDGKHRVVLGGSWATHPRIAERHSFRNWYQAAYPYVFSGFRLCRSTS